MYTFLLKYFKPQQANILIAIWYILLILAILYFHQYELEDFRYDDY